jgi:hypothetical protein
VRNLADAPIGINARLRRPEQRPRRADGNRARLHSDQVRVRGTRQGLLRYCGDVVPRQRTRNSSLMCLRRQSIPPRSRMHPEHVGARGTRYRRAMPHLPPYRRNRKDRHRAKTSLKQQHAVCRCCRQDRQADGNRQQRPVAWGRVGSYLAISAKDRVHPRRAGGNRICGRARRAWGGTNCWPRSFYFSRFRGRMTSTSVLSSLDVNIMPPPLEVSR